MNPFTHMADWRWGIHNTDRTEWDNVTEGFLHLVERIENYVWIQKIQETRGKVTILTPSTCRMFHRASY